MSWELSLPLRSPLNETPGRPWELVYALPPDLWGIRAPNGIQDVWSRLLVTQFDRSLLYSMLNQP